MRVILVSNGGTAESNHPPGDKGRLDRAGSHLAWTAKVLGREVIADQVNHFNVRDGDSEARGQIRHCQVYRNWLPTRVIRGWG
jgi:hypothetical protein